MRRKVLLSLLLFSSSAQPKLFKSLCDASSWSLPDYTHVPELIVPRS